MKKRASNPEFLALPLTNNFMFAQVMRQKDICKLFLEALLQKEIANIEYIDKEKDLSDGFGSHGVRLDVYMKNGEGVYNIEMQTTSPSRPALEKRIRYYQSNMDRHTLDKGAHYDELTDSYVIFVCNFDYYGKGLAVYEKYAGVKGADVVYEDGSHVFILNSECTEKNAEQPILEFLDLVHSNDVTKVYDSELMKMVCPAIQEVRGNKEKEGAYMTWKMSMEEAKREGKMEGKMEGELEAKMAIVRKMRSKGFTDDEIVEITDCSPDILRNTPKE